MLLSHPLLLIVCFALQTTSCLALLYSYCEFKQTQFEVKQYNENAGRFFVDIVDTSKESLEQSLFDIVKNCPIEVKCVELFLNDDHNIKTVITGERQVVNYGNDFDSSSEKEVIIPLELQIEKNYHIGDAISILGENYTIVGIRKSTDIEVNFDSLNKNQLFSAICISLNTIPSKKSIEAISSIIENNLEIKELVQPKERDVFSEISFDTKLVSTFLLVLLTVLNVNMIYSYLLYQRKKQHAIYRICGLTKSKLIAYCIVELSLYHVVALIFAIVLFFTINKHILLFKSIQSYDYIFPCIIFTIVFLYSGIEKIVISLKNEPIRNSIEG